MKQHLISVVVPCYNEQESLPLFYKEICRVAEGMPAVDFEFLFVNDGSKDDTLAIAKQLAETDSRVKYISFSATSARRPGCMPGWRTRRATMWR